MDLTYISVDVEASGPSPGAYSLLSLGACVVTDPDQWFYAELQPDRDGVDESSVAVSGLSPQRLRVTGRPPAEALAEFVGWVDEVAGGSRPVLVALNAPFDWMFVADALQRHVGRNPFGHSAIDMKALFMGVAGAPWDATSLRHMADRYDLEVALPHHARDDAVVQARVFRAILEELDTRRRHEHRVGDAPGDPSRGNTDSRPGKEHDDG